MIFRMLKISDEKEVVKLLKQLTTKKLSFSINSCIEDPSITCLVVEEDKKVIGFGSLIIYQIPTKGLVGRLEDIVVDKNCRGKGIGKKLVEELIKIASCKKINLIELTSKPTRVGARKLYEKLGFKLMDTGVFRKTL